MAKRSKETDEPRLDPLVEDIGDIEWTDAYWSALFHPLRSFLIKRLSFLYSHLRHHDIEDAADEIIYRLCKHFDFARLAEVPRAERRRRFFDFVRKTARSVMAEVHKQKGLGPTVSSNAATSVERRLIRQVAPSVVNTAFRSLAPEEQETLRYKVFEKLSYREIQVRCGERGVMPTIGALKMRFSRATRALRLRILKLLSEAPGGEHSHAKNAD